MSTFYSLLLPKKVTQQLYEVRTQLFRQSGGSSFRKLEPWIVLGETEDTSLEKQVSCPQLPLPCSSFTTFQNQVLFLSIPDDAVKALRTELGINHPYTGIYLGEADLPCNVELPPIDDVRLALVEIQDKGELTTWRILAEKHLQRDRGL